MQEREEDVTKVMYGKDCVALSSTRVALIYYPTFTSVHGSAGLLLCCPAPALLVAGLP